VGTVGRSGADSGTDVDACLDFLPLLFLPFFFFDDFEGWGELGEGDEVSD
jgi:hypothetical protein